MQTNALISRDSDNTTFEVLGEASDYDGRPKVFIRQCGSIGHHRITQTDLRSDFTAFPNPAAVVGLVDAGAALRLMPLPDASDWMARANAVRWNKDLIQVATSREANAPARRIIRENDYGLVTEWAFIAPSACRWCDLEERDHGRRFAWLVGDHEYTAPTERMRLSRMQGRHALRRAAITRNAAQEG